MLDVLSLRVRNVLHEFARGIILAITDLDVDAVDTFIGNDSKVLDGYQPNWDFHKGYDDFQIAWPILEQDTQIIRSNLRFRVPAADYRHPTINLIFRGSMVSRVDIVPKDVCKPNLPFAAKLGLPPLVCGPHVHSWADNRAGVLISQTWNIPIRRPIAENLDSLAATFFWFCKHLNVIVPRACGDLVLPPPRLI